MNDNESRAYLIRKLARHSRDLRMILLEVLALGIVLPEDVNDRVQTILADMDWMGEGDDEISV